MKDADKMPWKSLNLSKLNNLDQNAKDRFAQMGGLGNHNQKATGLGLAPSN